MTNKQAYKRYLKVFIPAMAGYVLTIFGATFILNSWETVTPLSYIVGFIPAIFVFIFMWAQARHVLEIDEFMRMLQIKAMMWGMVLTMGATTAWGLLEFYTPVPKIPIFFVLPVFYGVYGIASGILHKQYNASCRA